MKLRDSLSEAIEAASSGVLGLLIGAGAIPIVGFAVAPAWQRLERFLPDLQRFR